MILLTALSKELAYDYFSLWCRLQLRILKINVVSEKRAELSSGATLFVGLNQQSLIDGLVWQGCLLRMVLLPTLSTNGMTGTNGQELTDKLKAVAKQELQLIV
jgi:hypothetical protein